MLKNTSAGGLINFAEDTSIPFSSSGSVLNYGGTVGDYDNDMNVDLLIANRDGNWAPSDPFTALYHNNGNGSFSSVGLPAGIEALSPGTQNFLAGFADLNGFKLGGASPAATAGGVQLGNLVGALTAFNPGDSGASPTSFSNQSGLGVGAFPGAAGGFLIYPNKTNTNQMQQVYSKP
ncbi:MAG: FG-GAP-like repeat-containing protein [Sulfuriferula sp.]